MRATRSAPSAGATDDRAKPHLSVIIPVRDSAALLHEQLDALAAQQVAFAWELIVVDDASRDDPGAVVDAFRGRLPPTRLLRTDEAHGAGHARNRGAAEAWADRLAFVDADDVVAPGWMEAIMRALDAHSVVVSRFEGNRLNDDVLASTRRLAQSDGLAPYRRPPYLPHAGGCGLAVHRYVHEQIGGFDEAFRRLQDTDYCWRLQLAGHELHFVPDAVVHIRFRGGRASLRQAFDYGRFDGRLYHRYRHHGMPRHPLRRELIGLARTLLALPRRARGADRPRWLRSLGNRLGRIIGRLQGPMPSDRRTSGVTSPGFARARRLRQWLLGQIAPTLTGVRTKRPVVALTFDDGPHPRSTPKVLEVLERHGARATFFMLGARARENPELVDRVAQAGHAIGNHGEDHVSLPALSARERRRQIVAGARSLQPHGRRLFRPPYGHQSPASWWSARRTRHQVVAWSAHVWDWCDHPADVLEARMHEALRPGAIVLLHDALATRALDADQGREALAEALDRVLTQRSDLSFVTLPELLAHGRARTRGWWKGPEPADVSRPRRRRPRGEGST